MEAIRLRLTHSSEDLRWYVGGLAAAALFAAIYAWSAYAIGPLVLPLVMAAVAFAVLAFARPWVGVSVAMLAFPLELVALPLPTGSLSPTEGALALVGIAYVARLLVRPDSIRKPSVRDVPYLVLLLAIAVGIAFAEDPAPVGRVLVFWTLFYAVHLQVQSFSPKEMRNVVVSLVIGAGILAAIGAIQFIQIGNAGLEGGGQGVNERVSGTFGSGSDQSATNYFASALQLAALPAIALLVAAPRRYAWTLPLGAALIVGLFLSLSRGGTLGFVAGILLLLVLWGRARVAVTAVAVVLIGLTIAGANPLLGADAVSTIGQRLSTVTDFQESSTNLRPRAYSTAIELTAENPLFGIGVNQFQSEVAKRGAGLAEEGQQGQVLEGAHNVFLSLGAETGLIGLGGFCFFVALLIGRARAAIHVRDPFQRALALGFSAALFGFAVQGMTVTQNRNNLLWATFLVIAGMLVAIGDRADRELREESEPSADSEPDPEPESEPEPEPPPRPAAVLTPWA